MNGFVQNYDIKDEYSSSSTLAYRGIKKQTKIPKMLLGLSSVLLFNSIDNINVGNMGTEARAALLRVRTRPECPEGNLRDLTG